VKNLNIGALSGIITILFGIAYSLMAYNLPKAAIGNPMAPAIFPLILGVGMTILGICLFIVEVRKNKAAAKSEAKKETGKGLAYDSKLIIFTCVLALIYALLFERIGYVLSTSLFMGSLLFALNGKAKWKNNVLVAVGFSVCIYLIFQKLLNIPLPMIPFLEI
jgi:putative tricarboxylic transport membrane protein